MLTKSFLRWLSILMLLVGFGLRVYRLDFADISGDEAWSVTVSGWELGEIVASDAEFNPPLYHILLHAMMQTGGTSPFAMRYLSVIAGILGVTLVAKLGQLLGGRQLGMLTLFAGIFSPFLIYYAQDARFYSVVLVGSASSLIMLTKLAQAQMAGQKPPLHWWLLYALAALATLFSHYYAFAIMTAQAVFLFGLFIYQRKWVALRAWLVTWTAMAVLYLPWLIYSASFLGTRTYYRFDQWTLDVLGDLGGRTLLAYGAGITMPVAEQWRGWGVVALAGLGVVGLWWHKRHAKWSAFFPLTLVLGCITFAWGMNPILPFFYERYLLVGMPAFLLLIAAGNMLLFRLNKPLGVVGLMGLLVLTIPSLNHQYFNPTYIKGSYGRLLADLQSRAEPNDLILLNNPLQGSLYEIYGDEKMPAQIIDRAQIITPADTATYLDPLSAGYQRVWLVEYGNPAEYDPDRHTLGWLGQQGSRTYYENYTEGGVLYLFVLENAANAPAQTLSANLNNEILLTSAQYDPVVSAGSPFLLTLHWQATADIARPYTVFIHILAADGALVAQVDTEPGGGGNPTQNWAVGQTVEDNYAVTLDPALAAGIYTIRAGMYVFPELTRIPILDSTQPSTDNAVELGTVTIE